MKRSLLFAPLLLAANLALAGDAAGNEQVVAAAAEPQDRKERETGRVEAAAGSQPGTGDEAKELSGMSVLGNREAPKALVIVPWRSSTIGDSLGISTMLDDSRQPVDREVFMRALGYYEIRSERTP